MKRRKKVAIIGFGGTIAMESDASGTRKPAKKVEEILEMTVSLTKSAQTQFMEVEDRDSTNINPTHWTKLIHKIVSLHDEVDGIIITHGTDTMAYTAGAVSLGLGRGLKIPIVFTGSQIPIFSYGSDASFNLENAMSVILRASEEHIAEVMIVMSDRVLRGNRAIKVSESRFQAFESPSFPILGHIDAVGIHFSERVLHCQNDMKFDPLPKFESEILTIDLVPGLNPELLMDILKSGKCKGLLLRAFGAGNVPNEDEYTLIPVIAFATSSLNIPVLVSTKIVGGRTILDLYEPGKAASKAGAIATGDLTDVMAQVKLMWALKKGFKSMEKLAEIIHTDYVGEITV